MERITGSDRLAQIWVWGGGRWNGRREHLCEGGWRDTRGNHFEMRTQSLQFECCRDEHSAYEHWLSGSIIWSLADEDLAPSCPHSMSSSCSLSGPLTQTQGIIIIAIITTYICTEPSHLSQNRFTSMTSFEPHCSFERLSGKVFLKVRDLRNLEISLTHDIWSFISGLWAVAINSETGIVVTSFLLGRISSQFIATFATWHTGNKKFREKTYQLNPASEKGLCFSRSHNDKEKASVHLFVGFSFLKKGKENMQISLQPGVLCFQVIPEP